MSTAQLRLVLVLISAMVVSFVVQPNAIAAGEADGATLARSIADGDSDYYNLWVEPWNVNGSPLKGEPITDAFGMSNPHEQPIKAGCALARGRVACWQYGTYGIGTGGVPPAGTERSIPVLMGGPLATKKVTRIFPLLSTFCAIAEYQIYCWSWGYDSWNQPMLLDTDKVMKDKKVSSAATDGSSACAVAGGEVFCWGARIDGPFAEYASPVKVDGAAAWGKAPVTSVSIEVGTACATAAGRAYCWGQPMFISVGNGTPFKTTVVKPASISAAGPMKGLTVKQVRPGAFASCAVAGNGSVRKAYCWGMRDYVGSTPGKNLLVAHPVDTSGVLKGKTITEMAGPGCVITSDGLRACWSPWSPLIGPHLLPELTPADQPKPRAPFADVPEGRPLYQDLLWASQRGIAPGNGRTTFRPAESATRQTVAAYLFRMLNPGQADPVCQTGTKRQWNDVTPATPNCGSIEWLKKAGISWGTSFRPTAKINRAEAASWVFRAHHPGMADQKCLPTVKRLFRDVAANAPNCGNIEWLALAGLTSSTGIYSPAGTIRRDSVIALLHREQILTRSLPGPLY